MIFKKYGQKNWCTKNSQRRHTAVPSSFTGPAGIRILFDSQICKHKNYDFNRFDTDFKANGMFTKHRRTDLLAVLV